MSFLATSGLCKYYGGLHAVHDVDFRLEEGEVRALIGPNGAGKTTFVGMLCGRVEATAGRVTFLDQDVTSLPAHKRIVLGMGYTFQITSIFSRLTLFENVALAVRRRIEDRTKTAAEVGEALAQVGLDDRTTQTAGDLSYGHQRLLEIAMGLGQKPRLLILDEPTQGLADGEIVNFMQLLKAVSADTTILLIEHNMDVVMEVADKITVMNNGEILAEGTPALIRKNPAVQAAYLGIDDA